MGYYVSSVLSVSGGSPHDTFIYFLPSRRLEHDWVNEWIRERFGRIAAQLGPSAVLITSTPGREQDYLSSFESVDSTFRAVDGSVDVLHSGFPFLVVASTPVGAGSSHVGEPGIVVNLAGFDPGSLARLFDALIDGRRALDDLISLIPDTSRDLSDEYDSDLGGWDFAFQRAIELKPNVFGIGLDLNAIYQRIRGRGGRGRRGHRALE